MNPGLLDNLYADTQSLLESGELSEQERKALEANCAIYEAMSEEERFSHNYFLHHMPDSDADLVLVILKGHLLIEQRIREFIAERMLSTKPLESARLSAHQVICLAESLTLPNEEICKLWRFIRELNSIRNQLAHQLDPKIEGRVDALIAEYAKTWPVRTGLHGMLGHMFGQLSELCRLACSPEFQVRGKSTKPPAKS